MDYKYWHVIRYKMGSIVDAYIATTYPQDYEIIKSNLTLGEARNFADVMNKLKVNNVLYY